MPGRRVGGWRRVQCAKTGGFDRPRRGGVLGSENRRGSSCIPDGVLDFGGQVAELRKCRVGGDCWIFVVNRVLFPGFLENHLVEHDRYPEEESHTDKASHAALLDVGHCKGGWMVPEKLKVGNTGEVCVLTA